MGEWYIYSKQESAYCSGCSKHSQERKIYNEKGILKQSTILIEDKDINWKAIEKSESDKQHYIILRKRVIVDGKTKSLIEYDTNGKVVKDLKY